MAQSYNDGNLVADTPYQLHLQPPMQIDEALRQHCSISARRYFVAVILDDGSPMTFSGPGATRLDSNVVQHFFDLDRYRRVMEYLDSGATSRQSLGFASNPTFGYLAPCSDLGTLEQSRKRPRVYDDNQAVVPVVSTTRKAIKIGNSEDLVAKAWVKVIQPKKQSAYPYTGGDDKAPEWWPKEKGVPHKGPDHLPKREHIHLLCHILRLIVKPKDKQHSGIQKLNLNVEKLEEAATEALSAFFADKENSANEKKRPYLNEIFNVTKQEERLEKGEIDGTTPVYVMAGDKILETYSKNDDDDQVICDDDATKPSTTQSSMPPKLDFSPSTAPRGMSFPVDLHTPMILGTTPEQRGFVNGNTIPNGDQNSVHQTSRKYASDNLASTNLSRQTGVYYQQWSSSCTSTHQTGPSEANPGSLDTEHSIDGLPRHYSTEGFQAGGVLQQLAQTSCGDDFRSHCGRWF